MSNVIDYDHSLNAHSLISPRTAIPLIFPNGKPKSLLDVGCGTGTWLRAAIEFGIEDVFGVDGVEIGQDKLLIGAEYFSKQNLTHPWDLKRKFEAIFCLEVAEHLSEANAATLIDALVKHSDLVIFSGACPNQPGQHHVNCQWPSYWQKLFNERGFTCSDDIRWRIWGIDQIEPWYRQNMFVARRAPAAAGQEARILAAVHPDILPNIIESAGSAYFPRHVRQIEEGRMPLAWSLALPFRAAFSKLRRRG